MIEKIVTIGVYGTNEFSFYNALKKADVDVFCDIRLHRGMRGSKFAYVNSSFLQNRLKELGINYLHLKELAPSKEVRAMQKEDDKNSGVEKRTRMTLGRVFVEEYQERNLLKFDAGAFMSLLPNKTRVIALFCVERSPEACHRSLVGTYLKQKYSISVEDITP